MMKVVGEEGTSSEDYTFYQKGELLDAVYPSSRTFDEIDAACSPERQRIEFDMMYDVINKTYDLQDKKEIDLSSISLDRNSLTGMEPSSVHRNSRHRSRRFQISTSLKRLTREKE